MSAVEGVSPQWDGSTWTMVPLNENGTRYILRKP